MGWVLLLTPISAAAVIIALTTGREATVLGVISYVLSAYTLAALIVGLPKFITDIRAFINGNTKIAYVKTILYESKYTGLYLKNIPARVKVSLYMSLAINLIYAALKMATGIAYSSFWFGAEAVFYLVLGLVRFFILRNMRKGGGLKHEYKVYRFCGFLLFALNAALTGIVYQMIHQGMGKEYPGLLIYAVATFAFIFLANAIISLIKYRKMNSPVLSAAKTITLIQALVAIYSLQIAMFASFGEDERLALIMNSVFGGLLCIAIFGMAVFMVVRGFEKLKELQS
jgi:hypothetical protein